MKRRDTLKTVAAGAGIAVLSGAQQAEAGLFRRNKLSFNNDDFYKNGTFDVEKAKDAICELCEYHGYPIFPEFREKLWVSDYGTGRFTELGLAAAPFINNLEDRYMLMDLFLLPTQMLPEHWHVEDPTCPTKLEAWLVRHGKSYIVGIGEDNLKDFPQIVIPACQNNGKVTNKHVIPATPGMCVPLKEVKSRHWQFGGPEGAIITEVANAHTQAAVRHTDPSINDHYLAN